MDATQAIVNLRAVMYLGTGWDGSMGHLYRVGDMIPQAIANGFHGCESLPACLVCPSDPWTPINIHYLSHLNQYHHTQITGPSLYTGDKTDWYHYAMLGPYVPFYSEDMPNTGAFSFGVYVLCIYTCQVSFGPLPLCPPPVQPSGSHPRPLLYIRMCIYTYVYMNICVCMYIWLGALSVRPPFCRSCSSTPTHHTPYMCVYHMYRRVPCRPWLRHARSD